MTAQRVSYAQNGEDVRAWRALRGVAEPFYVEVGASHPFDDSLTAALYAEGWHGLLVEAEPAAAEVLRTARPRDTVVAAAASAQPGVLSWSDDGVRGHGQVTDVAGGLTVPAVRVGDLLEHVGPEAVHFLSVDVEGHEREALQGVDLERWQPWVLCVEATAPGSREQTHEAWEDVVLDAGYRFAAFDGLNRWYVAPGHEDLVHAVAEPFGVLDRQLDGWERAETVELHRRHAALEAHLRRVEDDAAAALRAVQEQLQAVEAERDAALERERVVLTSKSWAITRPLRGARLSAWTALQQWRVGHGTGTAQLPRRPDGPGDARRRAALVAKIESARRAGR